MPDKDDARQSLHEEKKAIRDYGMRGKRASSSKLKSIFHHARGEEKEHASKFKGFIRGSR